MRMLQHNWEQLPKKLTIVNQIISGSEHFLPPTLGRTVAKEIHIHNCLRFMQAGKEKSHDQHCDNIEQISKYGSLCLLCSLNYFTNDFEITTHTSVEWALHENKSKTQQPNIWKMHDLLMPNKLSHEWQSVQTKGPAGPNNNATFR